MITCERDGCEETFEKKKHNQKYCTDECCRLATNARIMKNYYARRDQRQGKQRWCGTCGVTKLSRYNDSQTCSSCTEKKTLDANDSVVAMLMNASFAS